MPINFASRSVVLFFIVSLIMACDATNRYGFNTGTVDVSAESVDADNLVEASAELVDEDANSGEISPISAQAESGLDVSGEPPDNGIDITFGFSEEFIEPDSLSGDLEIEIENTFIKLSWNNSGDYDYYHVDVSYDGGVEFESLLDNSIEKDEGFNHKLNISRLHSTTYKVTACDTDEPNNCPGTAGLAHDTKSIQITDYIDQIEANYIKHAHNNDNVTEFGTGVALSDNGEILAVASKKGNYDSSYLAGREIGQASVYKNPIGVFGGSQTGRMIPAGVGVVTNYPALENVTDVALNEDGDIVAMVSPTAVIAYTLDSNLSAAAIDFSTPGEYEAEPGTDHTFGNLSLSDDGSKFVVGVVDNSGSLGSTIAYPYGPPLDPNSTDKYWFNGYLTQSLDEPLHGNVSLSGDGNTLAIGVQGVGVYLFRYVGNSWDKQVQQPPRPTGATNFASSVSLNDDGSILAVASEGVEGSEAAVYLYTYANDEWTPRATLKEQNAPLYASSISLSGDGSALAVGAPGESGSAKNISPNPPDDFSATLNSAGAVYLYALDDGVVKDTTYIKASNPGADDLFGTSVALSEDGGTLAVGAIGEDGNTTDVNSDNYDNDDTDNTGAVYLY